jgi:alpha-1,2-mannosyltransferase
VTRLPLPDSRRQWIALAAAAVTVAAVLALRLPGLLHYRTPDLHPYISAAAALLHGADVYVTAPGTLPFTYPPFAALAFVPLKLVPFQTAGVLVTIVSLSALFVTGLVSLRMAAGEEARASGWRLAAAFAVFAAALLLEPVGGTLRYGQVNLVLLALVLVDVSGKHGRLPQGILIGLAMAIKLTPGIFIVYFLVTRRFKAAVTATVTFLAASAVAFLVLPHSSLRYWTGLIFKFNRIGVVRDARNQSLYGVLARLQGGAHHAHLLWIVLALLAACLGLALAALLSRRGHELWGACACGLTGVLVSPISWDHHWVWVVPALVALGWAAWRRRSWPLAVAAAAWWAVFFLSPIWWVMPQTLLWRRQHTVFVWVLPHALDTSRRLSLVTVFANSYVLAGMLLLAGLAVWALGVETRALSAADVAPPRAPT